MSITELAEQSVPFALNLNAKFRNTEVRTGALISGASGWGEFAPFPEYSDDVCSKWLAGALESAFGTYPARLRNTVPVNSIIPMLTAEQTILAVESAVTNYGMTTFKIKVADSTTDSLASDESRVKAVRTTLDRLGVVGKIRIDVNAQWNVSQAIRAIQILDQAAGGLDYVEQPCASISELIELKNQMQNWEQPIQIAVDESLRIASNVDIAGIRAVADILIVKAIPLGGVQRALELVAEIGLPAVVSGSLDSSVGLSSGIALAASIPQLYGACGLGTGTLFAQDLVTPTTLPKNGELIVRRASPDAHLLATSASRVNDSDRLWWQERIVRAWHSGAKDLVSPNVREAVER
jgi:O-succinylbenzoate synthase